MMDTIRSFALSVMVTITTSDFLFNKNTQNLNQCRYYSSVQCQINPSLNICQIGDCDRIRSTACFILGMAMSISSTVLRGKKLNRTLLNALVSSIPMAVNTCEGARLPDTQAAPADKAIAGSLVISSLAGTCLK